MNRIWLLIIIILAILCLVALISMAVDNHRFVTRTYTVTSPKVREPLTFVFVTDLHAKVYRSCKSESASSGSGKGRGSGTSSGRGHNNSRSGGNSGASFNKPPNQPLLDAIDRVHPDAVLVGGDMIISREARDNTSGWMDAARNFLTALAARYPVYMADGNHEGLLLEQEEFHSQYEAWCRMAREIGVTKLHNMTAAFKKDGMDTGVRIAGLDLDHETYQKIRPYHLSEQAVEEKLGPLLAVPARAAGEQPARSPGYAETTDPVGPDPVGPDPVGPPFVILLAHNPKYFDAYAAWGADLVLSGHVHGGLMRIGRRGLIGPDLHLFPKYSGGIYENNSPRHHSTMIVSCGLGSHTLPVRIFNPGELTVIHVEPSPGLPRPGTDSSCSGSGYAPASHRSTDSCRQVFHGEYRE